MKKKKVTEEVVEEESGDIFDKKYDLTEDHYEMFQDEFQYWVNMYGLKGWELHFSFDKETGEDARAQIFRDHDARITIVMLATKWQGCEPTEYNIRKCAFHEASELLLSKINDLTRSRCVTDKQIEEEIHNLIRVLENTHWTSDYVGRINEISD
jgi:hypothetical protein